MKKNNRIISNISVICLMLGCILFLNIDYDLKTKEEKTVSTKNIETKQDSKHESKDIAMLNTSDDSTTVQKLQDKYQNKDIKAILEIENSNLKEIVVQTTNNEYYLNHNYKLEEDKLGSIYADYRVNLNAGRKILIFGHSSTKKQTPFNTLENYYDQDYYKTHKYITLKTNTNTYRYEIFSVYVETNDFTYMNLNFDSTNDWYLHILKLQKKSLYKIDVELVNDDDILILQTCSTNPNYKKYSKKYLLIVSRRVK